MEMAMQDRGLYRHESIGRKNESMERKGERQKGPTGS